MKQDLCLLNTNALDNGQFQRWQRSKETIRNMLSQEIHLCNMKALIFMDQCNFFYYEIGQSQCLKVKCQMNDPTRNIFENENSSARS